MVSSTLDSRDGAAWAPPRSWRARVALAGSSALVAIGYIDPGNWATDLAGGSRFGYALLGVVIASSLLAMLLQMLSARLGIVTGRDLAAASREAYPRAAWCLWISAEVAVIATDVAEVIGAALALQLLFGVPLAAGVVLTGADVALLLALEHRRMHSLELIAVGLAAVVGAGLVYELALCRPAAGAVVRGLLPPRAILHDREMLLCALGIVGATIMPHNLFLHSSLVRQRVRAAPVTMDERRKAVARSGRETAVSLGVAMLLNAVLVVIAAAVFHRRGAHGAVDIAGAHRLLAPLLGSAAAPVVFAVALLAAGESASLAGTMAGQVIMSGFLRLRWSAAARRGVTRACAMVPALGAVIAYGEAGTARLLIASQVALSFALPFATIPLIALVSDRKRMGGLRPSAWVRVVAWLSAIAIVFANGALVVLTVRWVDHAGPSATATVPAGRPS